MSISVGAVRRLHVSNLQINRDRYPLKTPGLTVLAVGHHSVDELYQVFADLPHSHALNAGMRALEEHREEVCSQSRVLKPGRLAKAQHALVLADPVLLDHTASRMIGVGKLGQGIAKRGAPLFHRAELGGGALAPVLEKPVGVSAMLRAEI